jgi:dCMP deaminase
MNPHKEKYFQMYQDMAQIVAEQSYCVRKKVGAIVIQPDGVIGIGFNGTRAGKPNICELPDGTTDPEVTHAEINALNKLDDPSRSIVFTTLSPCRACSEALLASGVVAVYYRDLHCEASVQYLRQYITVNQWR